jgi:hypothetical protein
LTQLSFWTLEKIEFSMNNFRKKWPNYGTPHPSYRFSIGQRVEILVPHGVGHVQKTTPDPNGLCRLSGTIATSMWTSGRIVAYDDWSNEQRTNNGVDGKPAAYKVRTCIGL